MKQTEDKEIHHAEKKIASLWKKKSVSLLKNCVRLMRVEKKIGVSTLMRASAKGGSGVYLYIPRDYADTYGIESGDKVETRLIRVFKEKEVEVEEKSTNMVDISQRKKLTQKPIFKV